MRHPGSKFGDRRNFFGSRKIFGEITLLRNVFDDQNGAKKFVIFVFEWKDLELEDFFIAIFKLIP